MSDTLSKYAWIQDNQKNRNFSSFDEEIAYMKGIGYELVPAEYRIPHWAEKLTRAGTVSEVPDLFVLRIDGSVEVMSSNLDCYAAEVGYPLYFKPSEQAKLPVRNSGGEL
jgi:hypothetical protein